MASMSSDVFCSTFHYADAPALALGKTSQLDGEFREEQQIFGGSVGEPVEWLAMSRVISAG
jgi:hypothetical protein